jgi:hypothetical protein
MRTKLVFRVIEQVQRLDIHLGVVLAQQRSIRLSHDRHDQAVHVFGRLVVNIAVTDGPHDRCVQEHVLMPRGHH